MFVCLCLFVLFVLFVCLLLFVLCLCLCCVVFVLCDAKNNRGRSIVGVIHQQFTSNNLLNIFLA